MTRNVESLIIVAITVVLASSLALFLLLPSTKKHVFLLKQPAQVTKLIRTLRPYSKVIIIIIWIYVRMFHSSGQRGTRDVLFYPKSANHTTGDVNNNQYLEFQKCGILDMVLLCVHSVSLKFMAVVHDRFSYALVDSIVSKLCLYVNDFLGIVLVVTLVRYSQRLMHSSMKELQNNLIDFIFSFAKNHISIVRNGLLREEEKMEVSLKNSLWKKRQNVTKVLPKEGKNIHALLEILKAKSTSENETWKNGYVSGAVYGGDEKHTKLLNDVYSLYSLSNPLHPDIWPSINQCEAEVISMTAGLLNGGDENVVGAMTSGGTESIIMAVRAHLKVYGENRGIEYPEIVCGDTAHAGLNKACEMFGIRLVQIPCVEETGYQLDPDKVEQRISSNVIMIYSSAPCYPQGVIDPIEKLSMIALKYDIGLHVDACLGGFVLPFAQMMNYNVPNFDFICPGVTSMSVDTHKYGYASKGTSVVLYRNKTLRRAQFFNYAKWTGGLYSTPTIAGSRAGGLIACAWASLVAIGEDGFKNRVKLIMETTREIAIGVSKVRGLKLLGCNPHPQAMIVCFTCAKGYELNIYQVAEFMNSRGWNLNSLQNPASIHLCVTLNTVGHEERFITDLKNTVDDLLANPPQNREGSSAAIYGATGSMPPGPVNELLKVYTDVTLSC